MNTPIVMVGLDPAIHRSAMGAAWILWVDSLDGSSGLRRAEVASATQAGQTRV